MKTAEEGERLLEQLVRFLERDYESASRSLREGMKERFTLQRLHIPDTLHECLATTNIIESPQGGVLDHNAAVADALESLADVALKALPHQCPDGRRRATPLTGRTESSSLGGLAQARHHSRYPRVTGT